MGKSRQRSVCGRAMPPTVNIIPVHLPLEPPPPPPPPPGKNDDAKDAAKEAERRRLKEAQKKESVEAEQRIETKKKFELNFGARLKAGLSGQEKKKQFHEQVKKMKDAQFDMKQAVEEFARMNDPEAIVFFDPTSYKSFTIFVLRLTSCVIFMFFVLRLTSYFVFLE